MKKTHLLFAAVFAFLAFTACDDEEETVPVIDNGQEEEYDDAYYASQASVTSSDANFTATDEGGEIWFKTEGGSVTLSVSCGTEWTADNSASDLFPTSATSSTLTVTAEQNTVEQELEGTITLRTANQRIAFATITVTQSAYGAPEISVEASEWGFPAKGTLTAEIAVEASADWTAETGDSWLTVARDGEILSLTAEENAQKTERSAKVTLTCTDGIRSAYEYVVVTQDASAYITTDSEVAFITVAGGTTSVTVESNYEWDYYFDSSNGWFTVVRNGNELAVTADENGDEDRSAEITLTAGDGAENVAEVRLTVFQAGANAMVLTYRITTSNTTAYLPLYGEVDCTVNWGDGTSERVTSSLPSHVFTGLGNFDITVSGKVTALYSKSISTYADPLPLTTVKQWGNTGLTDMQYAFYECNKLTTLPEQTGDAFADVTSFAYAFEFCSTLKEIPAGMFAGCTKATSFEYVFYQCYALSAIPERLFENCTSAEDFTFAFGFCNAVPEIPADLFKDCTAATKFYNVFVYCTSLTKVPAGLFDSCTKATNLYGVFENCLGIEEIPEGLFDNCTEVTNFIGTFYYCMALKKIPKGLFDKCTKAKSFRECFYHCSALEEIPEGLFDNCPDVTNFSFCFYRCQLIESIPAGLFDNCPKVTEFNATFYQCYDLTEIPAGLFDKNTEVTDFGYTFSFCYGLTKIPAGLFDNCTKVTAFNCIFQRIDALTEIPEGLFDNCPDVTTFQFVFNFSDCEDIKKVPTGLFDHNLKVTDFSRALCNLRAVEGESPYTEVEVNGEPVKVHLYDRANYTSELGCVAPTSYSSCFTNSTFDDMDSIPSGWGGNGTGVQAEGVSTDQVMQTETKKYYYNE